MTPPMTPQQRAEASAAAMWANDAASTGLGMVLEEIGPGRARVSMTVQPRMLNGYGTCHGGFIFALADSAFASACNTDGAVSVAAQCSVAYLRPVPAGAHLVAVAAERFREGRTGITDVTVTLDGTTVAEFRGQSRTTGARTLPENADAA